LNSSESLLTRSWVALTASSAFFLSSSHFSLGWRSTSCWSWDGVADEELLVFDREHGLRLEVLGGGELGEFVVGKRGQEQDLGRDELVDRKSVV